MFALFFLINVGMWQFSVFNLAFVPKKKKKALEAIVIRVMWNEQLNQSES